MIYIKTWVKENHYKHIQIYLPLNISTYDSTKSKIDHSAYIENWALLKI